MTAQTLHAASAHLPTGLAREVRLTVDDGRFAAIETDAPAQPGDHRLPGVVLPGLANAHSHAFHRALRGRVNGGGGNFWSWREQMYAAAEQLNPDTYFALARAVFAEMVQAGFTVVGEGIVEVRTRGLWAGIDIEPALMSGREMSEAMLAKGVLVKDTHGSTIRLAPPLVIEQEDLEWMVAQLGAVLAEAH